MNITPILHALRAAGATPEMLIAAVEAFEKEKQREMETRREHERNKKRKQRLSPNVPKCPGDNRDNPSPLVPPSQVSPTPPSNSPPYNPPNPEDSAKAALWKVCRLYLGESKMTLVGKWAKLHPPEKIYTAVLEAQQQQVADPVAYIQRILSPPDEMQKPINRMPSPAGG